MAASCACSPLTRTPARLTRTPARPLCLRLRRCGEEACSDGGDERLVIPREVEAREGEVVALAAHGVMGVGVVVVVHCVLPWR